jgi:hypothetical protein
MVAAEGMTSPRNLPFRKDIGVEHCSRFVCSLTSRVRGTGPKPTMRVRESGVLRL